MTDLEIKRDMLLQLASLRKKLATYRYIHVFSNDKFCKSIVEFISGNFSAGEHAFVFCGGVPESEIPLPQNRHVYSFPHSMCLPNSPVIQKFIFHGLYAAGIGPYLYKNRDILAKSYWIPWGRDIYLGHQDDDGMMKYVKSHMRGVAANGRVRKVYQERYGDLPDFFPYDITYESIPYELIVATTPPRKDYVQILVNNSAHESTLEALDYLQKFRNENIRVATILSYGEYAHTAEIVKKGKSLFGSAFMPIEKFIPAEQYLKFLARNDIYILNQSRPQGMTTFFTMMLLGKKVFMRSDISDYLREDGYVIDATEEIPAMTFERLLHAEGIENNKTMAARRFDREHVKNFWQTIINHQPAALPS